jgi:hypothetical protein
VDKKKLMAYLNWNRAKGNRVNASLIADPLNPAKRRMNNIHKKARQNKEEQQSLYFEA